MPRRFIRRTKSAFDSRTQEWREVGLGSEIVRGDARRGLGGIVVAIATMVLWMAATHELGFHGMPVLIVGLVVSAVTGIWTRLADL